MTARLEVIASIPDGVKWTVVTALVAVATGGFYYYAEQSLLLRVIVLVAAVGAALVVAVQTSKGGVAWDFILDARVELRKVVWPTRKETVQTTMIVVGMVALVAVILWMLDGIFSMLIKLLLGQGG